MAQPARTVYPARSSTAAIVSLIAGVVSLLGGCVICALPPVIAVLAGHIGIARTRRGHLRGHGLALTGTIIGYVTLIPGLVGAALFLYFNLEPGDLFDVSNNPTATPSATSG